MGKRIARFVVVSGVVALAALVWANIATAQTGPGHSMAIVVHDDAHATSPPLRNIPPIPSNVLSKLTIRLRHPHPLSGVRRLLPDPALQTTSGPAVATTSGSNFFGIGVGLGNFSPMYAPPDTNGAVGPTEYVQWVNVNYAVFAKYNNEVINNKTYTAGQLVYGPLAGNQIFSALGGACASNNSGDPVAEFDKQANRWVLMQPVFSTPYTICVAVSQTSDATGAYNLYAFPIPPYPYSNSNPYFPDYPKLGVWPDGYYLSYNSFQGNTFKGAAACAMDRVSMLQGKPATMQCFQRSSSDASLLPSDLDGDSGAAGTTAAPPAGTPNYYLELGGSTNLNLYKFHVDWTNSANSTFTGPISITVPSYSLACGGGTCIPQSGTNEQLDSLGDRLMYRLAYRNLNGVGTLVATDSVDTGSGNTGVRWYEIQGLESSKPTAVQASTYAPDSNYRWMGSIGMDKYGDIALGYSVSSANMYPAIRYTGQVAGTNATNTMEAETSIVEGGGSQLNNLNRWGDYSAMSIDPVNDCTFYYTNEYLLSNGTFNWSTRVGSFDFTASNCTSGSWFLSADSSIQSVGQGSSASYSLNLSPSNSYSGTVNLTATGLPPGATANFSNGTLPGTGGTSTLTVSTDSSVSAGTYHFTVQGNDGNLTSLTPLILVVTAPSTPDFAISATPGSATVTQGQNASYTVTVSSLNSYGGTVDLSASVSPSGPGTSIPPSVSVTSTTAGTATLTVSTTSSTTTGNYTVTITGTDSANSSLSHQTQVALQVNQAAQTGNFQLGAASGSLTVGVGSSNTDNITVTPSSGFTGNVSLSLSGLPRWTSSSFSSSTISITGTASVSSLLTISTNKHAQTGTWNLTLTATSGSLTQQIPIVLTVGTSATPDFSISATPSSSTVTQGQNASYTVNVSSLNSYSGTVNLGASVSPSGPSASIAPQVSVTSTTPGQATLTVSNTTTTGSYTVTITGTDSANSSLSHQTQVALVVNAPSSGDFSISATPGNVTLKGNSTATYTVSISPTGGFTGDVALSASATGIPGTDIQLTPSTVKNGSGTSTLSVTGASSGNYSLTITGTSGSLTHSTSVSLKVH